MRKQKYRSIIQAKVIREKRSIKNCMILKARASKFDFKYQVLNLLLFTIKIVILDE